jgi:hypothetical protein
VGGVSGGVSGEIDTGWGGGESCCCCNSQPMYHSPKRSVKISTSGTGDVSGDR